MRWATTRLRFNGGIGPGPATVWLVTIGAVVAAASPDEGGSTARLAPTDTVDHVVRKAAHVVPAPRQLAWQEVEFASFVCFGVNTFTDREWGDGKEDPAIFNPTEFDAHEIVRVCKDAGINMVVFLAKHHDGFCLWPSAYTEHSVKNSPWRSGEGDMVREMADACREAGLKLSIYLSPWDRHEPTYGDSPVYNTFFMNQLRELLTNYGPVADVWFDGACGEGPNGKRQVYDWEGYYALIRELQPDATISISGPDARWCGNEAGVSRESEWSVVPENAGAQDADLGSRARLMEAAKQGHLLKWYPAQVDTSIRPGWFYHASQDDKVKSLDKLLDIYYGAVGGNAQLLLNMPIDPRGKIHENDVARIMELRRVLDATFDEDLASGAKARADTLRGNDPRYGADLTVDGDKETYWSTDDGVTVATLEYDLGAPRTFNRAMLQEYIKVGQRIEAFSLDVWNGETWAPVAGATTVGYKRLLRFDDVTAQRVRIRITQSRVCPTLSAFGLFHAPTAVSAPAITRDDAGEATLTSAPGVEVRYWLGGLPPSASSRRYTTPFPLPDGGTVKAIAIPPDTGAFVRVGESLLSEATFEPLAGVEAPDTDGGDAATDTTTAWQNLSPGADQVTVQRVTETLPLSDQANAGGWEKYAPLTDEFEGTTLDAAKWWDTNPGWKGRQPGLFDAGNVAVNEGRLHLTMRKGEPPEARKAEGFHTYTCAAVKSKSTVRYGYFEVKAKPMASAGSSSFWFYDSKDTWWTEIDVFELGGKAPGYERKMNMNVHVFHTPAEERHWSEHGIYVAPSDLIEDYHVYGLEWDEERITFYFDGVPVRTGPNTHWHQPLTLNFDSETMPDWFGLPEDTDLPSTFSVEYVRVWKRR
jgi:alpha-L-fucosidase